MKESVMGDGGTPAGSGPEDAVRVSELVEEIRYFAVGDADVVVDIDGTLVDVCRGVYEHGSDRIILHLHPDDLQDVLDRLFAARLQQAGPTSGMGAEPFGHDRGAVAQIADGAGSEVPASS